MVPTHLPLWRVIPAFPRPVWAISRAVAERDPVLGCKADHRAAPALHFYGEICDDMGVVCVPKHGHISIAISSSHDEPNGQVMALVV